MDEYALTLYVGDAENLPRLSPKQFNAYRDEQAELRRIINERCVRAGRKPVFTNPLDDFSKYAVIPNGDGFRMVKREKPIDVVEYDNDGNAVVIANLQRSQADRIGLNAKRGKYNDGHLLVEQDSSSIELGELQASAGANNGF